MAALLSRQNPLLFMPGFFQKDDEGTDPLSNVTFETNETFETKVTNVTDV